MAQLPGPLVVSVHNPRYFAAPAAAGAPEKLIYLTDLACQQQSARRIRPGSRMPRWPERFDFDAYLGQLSERGHNFVRLRLPLLPWCICVAFRGSRPAGEARSFSIASESHDHAVVSSWNSIT